MFKGTKMFMAATAIALLPAVTQAKVDKPTRAELQKELEAVKASKAGAQMKKGAMLNANIMKAANMKKALGDRKASPFAVASQKVFGTGRPAGMRHARMEVPAANMFGYMNYDMEGLYEGEVSISTPSLDITQVGDPEVMGANAAWVDGKVKTIVVDDSYSWLGLYFFTIYSIDPETWTIEEAEDVDDGGYGWYALSMAAHPDGMGGFMESFTMDGSGLEFSYVDFTEKTKTHIAYTNTMYSTLSLGKDGMIYGLAEDNALYSINPATGAETRIGDTGLAYADEEGAYGMSAAIDLKTGNMFFAELDATGNDGGLYTVDLTTGAASLVQNWGIKQIYGLVIPAAQAADEAPAAAENLSATFENGSLNGEIRFTAPTTTYAGDVLAGNLTYTVQANGTQIAQAEVAPGEEVVVNAAVEEGINTFLVTTSNEAGESPKARVSLYVGYDTPQAPTDVTLAISAEGAVELTWTAPAAGINNGYLDALTYNVYVVTKDEKTQVATGLTECTYTTTIEVGELANYIYAVEAVNGQHVSAMVQSNGVVIGNALSCPVEFTMTSSDFNMMTVIDNNGDGRTWGFSSEGLVRYTYSASNNGDDYLVLPAVKLSAGRTYNLDVKAASYSKSFPEKLEVTIGQGATVEAQSTVIGEARVLPNDPENVEHIEFTVAESGEYNVALHAVSDADMYYLNLTGVSLTAGALPEAPQAVSDLAAVAGEKGALEATVSFVAPTLRVNGEALESIAKIVVIRDKKEVKVFEAPAPGETLSFVDTELANGINSWTVVAFNEAEDGPAAKVSAFVGVDVPAAPVATLVDLDTQVRIEWEAVTEGANGGYVDPSDLTYEIYAIDGGYIGELIASTTETSYTMDYNTNEGDADLLQVAMRTVSSTEQSSYIGSDALLVGAPVGLPWIEEFAGADIENFMWISQDPENKLSAITLSTDEGGVAAFSANGAGQSGSLKTGKISLAGAINPEVILNYTAWVGFKLEVIVETKTESEVIATVENEGDEEMHTLAAVIPAKYVSEPYVVVSFKATSATNGSLYIEDIMIRDVLEYNLSLTLDAPAKVTKGENIFVAASVINEGATEVNGVKVILTAGEQTYEMTSDVVLGSFEGVELIDEIPTSIFDESEAIDLVATVVYDLDLKPEDNEASATVLLEEPKSEGVHDLAAQTNADGTVTLSWSVSEASYAEFTDDFESYEEGVYGDGMTCGDYTAVNLDNGDSYGWDGLNWPHTGEHIAFSIVNPAAIGLSNILCNGDQCLMFMSVYDGNTGVGMPADKWLISPMLPGVAQTLSFLTCEQTANYGPEALEIMVSTTDNSVESFSVLEAIEINETEFTQYSFELPEGTKYFALHYVSNDIFCLYIENLTYTVGTSAPVSFEIYCDGELIGTTTECTYTVSLDEPSRARAASAAGHKFSVVAVYENGAKSAPVSVVADDIVGIEQIDVENAEAKAYNVIGARVNAAEVKSGVLVIDGQKVIK